RAEQIAWFGNLRLLVQPLVPRRRLRRPGAAPVAEPQEPRLRFVAVRPLDVLDSPLRVVVGRVAVLPFLLAVDVQALLLLVRPGVIRVLRPVPNDLRVPVAADPGVGAGVPLADVRGVVAAGAELRRPERALLRVVGAPGILPLRPHRLNGVRLVPG